jgi:DNA-binding beta-propeller fold protein YncE
VRPPRDQFYFPTGMDISPLPVETDQAFGTPEVPLTDEEASLFVANANSDLRYDSGTVQVVDLETVDDVVDQWLDGGRPPDGLDCSVDLLVPYTLVCDEREFIRRDATIRIGNFATELKVQRIGNGQERLRLFAAVRGDPSLTWIDYDVADADLSCSTSVGFSACDDEHRLVQLRNDEDFIALPDQPFGVYVDSKNQYVVLTHFLSGAITLADSPADGEPILSDAIANLFAGDPQSGFRAVLGVGGRLPGSPNNRIYVTSPIEARVQSLVASRPPGGGLPTLVAAEYFFMSRGVNTSNNGRGVAFSGDGNSAYILNRSPPMLHIIDTSLDEQGVPRNQFVRGVELCAEASNLTVSPIRGRDRIFVACFRNGQVWSVDPRGGVVDQIIEVGNGPQSLIASPGREKLYVANNLENTIAVVNLAPEVETENRVVLRVGRPQSQGEAP